MPGEARVVLRKPRPGAERLLPDGRLEPLCDLDESRPRLAARPLPRRRRRRGARRRRAARRARRSRRDPRRRRAGRSRRRRADRRRPPPERTSRPSARSTSAGPRAGRRCVPRTADRSGEVLRPDRLLDRHGVRAGQPFEVAGEERLVSEVAPVLLSDEHDERRSVDARRRQGADGVAETGGRVEEDEGRLVPTDRPAGRDPDDRSFVEPQDELEIGRKVDEQRHLGRAGVREHPCQPARPEDLDRRVADGHRSHSSDPTARSARVRRVRLLALAGGTGEDLRDHAEVALGREVRERDPAEVAAQQHAVPTLRLRRDRPVEVRHRDADVVHARPFSARNRA